MEPTLFDITMRIVLAAFLGGVIGLERQVKGKVAGLRTTMLICIGAALFMIISEMIADRSGDRSASTQQDRGSHPLCVGSVPARQCADG